MLTKKGVVITEKDIERMKSMSSKKSFFLIYVVFLLPAIVLLLDGIWKFILAQKYAQLIHKNISEIFNVLNHGFSSEETYSGTYCLAIASFGSSLDAFVGTIMVLCFLVIIITTSKTNLKLINYFESKAKQDIRQNEYIK